MVIKWIEVEHNDSCYAKMGIFLLSVYRPIGGKGDPPEKYRIALSIKGDFTVRFDDINEAKQALIKGAISHMKFALDGLETVDGDEDQG